MRIHPSRTAILLMAGAIVAGLTATTAALASGSSRSAAAGGGAAGAGPAAAARPGSAAFSWLRARGAPSNWRQAGLPGGGAVLSYPPSLHQVPGDRGTVSEELTTKSGAVRMFLNITPRQGDETPGNWAAFRLGHLREDAARSARLDSASTGLRFRGGTGSCVIDDYVTKAGASHFREIACYVRGAHRASVLIAATPAGDWGKYAGLLEQAVSTFTVT
jgi:hypothetical protein